MTDARTTYVRKQLKIETMIHGVSEKISDWRHPSMPSNANDSFDFYKQQAHINEKSNRGTSNTQQTAL